MFSYPECQTYYLIMGPSCEGGKPGHHGWRRGHYGRPQWEHAAVSGRVVADASKSLKVTHTSRVWRVVSVVRQTLRSSWCTSYSARWRVAQFRQDQLVTDSLQQ